MSAPSPSTKRLNAAGSPVLSAKQMEIRARGGRILDAAYPLVREKGLAAVSMEAIAREMQCTRGTIYNHYVNKEDILSALATRSVRRRMEMFRYAVTLSDQPRERCAAIGIAAEVYVDCLPDDFAIEQTTRHDPVWQKASPTRRELLAECEQQCINCLSGVIDAAIESGDLTLADGISRQRLTEQLVFGLWSLVYGGLVLEATSPSLGNAGILQPRIAIRRNCNALLDDLGWRPLYDSEAYHRFVAAITPKLRRHAKRLLEQPAEDSPA